MTALLFEWIFTAVYLFDIKYLLVEIQKFGILAISCVEVSIAFGSHAVSECNDKTTMGGLFPIQYGLVMLS